MNGLEVGEVVGVVGVAHDDVACRGRPRCRLQGAAVAACARRGTTRAPCVAGDLLRAVGAAVVGDDDLAVDAQPLEGCDGLGDAGADRAGLVQARHDDGDFEVIGPVAPE